MKLVKYLICGGLFTASAAFGVSRVGTGKLSNDDIGFSAPVPQYFDRSTVLNNGDVRFDGPIVMAPNRMKSPEQVYFVAFLLANAVPRWIGEKDRLAFRDSYVQAKWQRVPHLDPCIEQFVTESATNHTIVMSWGDGKGLVISGSKIDFVIDGLDRMAEELVLERGVCSWN